MPDDIGALVAELRKFGAEATAVEVKRAAGGLPKSVRETLSSFSNTPGGGALVLGLDEASGFAAVGLENPAKMMADLTSMCREDISPPLTPEIEMAEVDGRTVLVADIREIAKEQKPCYVRSLGKERGSYIRVGESDRRLTSEEVQQIVADRGQPKFDHEVVTNASMDDLDATAVETYVSRTRENSPRIFADERADVILRMTRVTGLDPDGKERPTLAGLLALGRYPQQVLSTVERDIRSLPHCYW